MGILRLIFRVLKPTRKPRPLSRIIVFSPTPSQATLPRPRHLTGPCWVVDGDTIIIQRTSIRLAGIDAPELDHPYGEVAKSAMIRLCRGQMIRADIHEQTSHDRMVATCTLPDGRDLAAEIVKMGLAVDWPKFSGGKYRSLEQAGVRKKLWRCDARQKGRFPPGAGEYTIPD